MAVLTTPTTQTVYNTLIDQSNIQSTAPYSTTSPQVYLTRLLTRFIAASHSPNTVLWGLNVTYSSGIGTNLLTFNVSPGSLIIDSNVFDFPTGFSISTDTIPNTTGSKLRVGIFAAYTFNAATAHNTANNVSFTSYVFDAVTDALVAPTLFGGSEKILIGTFALDLSGSNIVVSNRINDWLEIGNAATLAGTASQLSVTNAQAYPGFAYIDTLIPSGTLCDFTTDVVSGNATVKVGNTVPNSSELLNLTSAVPATLTGSFVTTANNQTIALGNTNAIVNDVAVFDNVQVEYPSITNLLSGDDSTFTNGIGSWVASATDSAYWDGAGAMITLDGYNSSYSLSVGIDIVANDIVYIDISIFSNLAVSVGITGVGSFDLLPITTVTSGLLSFTAPASGVVTISLSSAIAGTNSSISQIKIGQNSSSVIIGDDSTFTTTIGAWAAVSATAVTTAGQLVVTDTSAVVATGHASLVANVTANTTYALIFDLVVGTGYYAITGAIPTPILVNSIVAANGISQTITANATGTITIDLGSQLASSVTNYDNVYLVPVDMLAGDDSTFTTSIGTWTPSAFTASTSAGVATLNNLITTTTNNETDISQTITLQALSRYQFELTGITGGTFQVLDGVTIIASATVDGIVKFSTTVATSYTLKYFVTALTLNATATISNINIFPRLIALSAADSTFTSIANWKTTAFDNVYYAGNGLRLVDQLAFGAEISRTITTTPGTVYRVQITGDSLAQILVGATVADGSLLSAIGVINSTFTANAISTVVTLRVNSTAINAEAVFRGIKIFEDNTNTVQINTPDHSLASGGNLKALSVNNPSKTLRSSINIVGHGTFTTKGNSNHATLSDSAMINALDHAIGSWVIDIPKLKPTSTSLAYQITGVLR